LIAFSQTINHQIPLCIIMQIFTVHISEELATFIVRGFRFRRGKAAISIFLVNNQLQPGYHMNKKHWISVYPGEEISEALLRDLINDSWNLVVDGLAKRDQKRVRPG
jgi:predicted DNA-binding protein (MmcQ/YjbR family)